MLSSVFFIICKTNTNKIGQVNLTGAYVRLQLIRAYFGHLTLSPVRWIHNELKNKHRTRQIVDCWNICVFHAVKPRFGIAAIIQAALMSLSCVENCCVLCNQTYAVHAYSFQVTKYSVHCELMDRSSISIHVISFVNVSVSYSKPPLHFYFFLFLHMQINENKFRILFCINFCFNGLHIDIYLHDIIDQ